MKCYYEVLNVPRDAEDVEIKTAYRKLALKWHPDKNLTNIEYAKEQFQLVQQAYEVLSDKHERAWYDNHREQILHGVSSEFQDNSLDVFQYFGNCFQGYGDDENGFYTIYRNVFESIANEEMDFIEDKEEFCEIPNFGNSQTDLEKVTQFYAYWSNYITKKSYVWLDPYDIKDIKDRRYFKLVEKENKKVRQQAKKERNEEIRNLVAFVKKRDKRVQAHKKLLEQKQLENKKKREKHIHQKKLERQQELNNSNVQPDWARFDNVKSELEEVEKNIAEEFGDISNSESDTENYLNKLYCVACNKVFKTPKAFANHESSKKHKENIEVLKTVVLSEEQYMQENVSNELDYDTNIIDDLENTEIDSDEILKLENENKQHKHSLRECEDMKNENDSDRQGVKPKKKKKQKNVISLEENDEDIAMTVIDLDDEPEFIFNKKQKKIKRKNNKTEVVSICDQQRSESFVDNKLKKTKKDKKNKNVDASNTLTQEWNQTCQTCKTSFESKNKLFEHLKKFGHAVPIQHQK